jgi:hypothetical protein
VHGTGGAWGRKFINSFEANPTQSESNAAKPARLLVAYTGGQAGVPTLAINDVTVTEGTGGSTSASFGVTLSSASSQTVTVQYATLDGTATAPADYTAVSGTLTFAPGVTTQSIAVPIVTDAIPEPTQTFSVVLSNATNAAIADGSGTGTIVDDDAGAITATFQIASADDDVNEDGANFDSGGSSVWLGNASSVSASYTGLRFAGVTVPRGAAIVSAHLEVNAASTQWMSVDFDFAAEGVGDSAAFSAASKPSQRTLLAPRVSHSSNAQWIADTWYPLEDLTDVVQAVVNQSDWNTGHALTLVLHGTGGAWGRKFAHGVEGNPALAPRLVITYGAGQ